MGEDARSRKSLEKQLDQLEQHLDQVASGGGIATTQYIVGLIHTSPGQPEILDHAAEWLARKMYIGPDEPDAVGQFKFNEQVEVSIANALIVASRAEKNKAAISIQRLVSFLDTVADVAYNIDLVSYPEEMPVKPSLDTKEKRRQAHEKFRREHCLRSIEHDIAQAINWGLTQEAHEQLAGSLKTFQKKYESVFKIHRSYAHRSPREQEQYRQENTYPIDHGTDARILKHHRAVKIANIKLLHSSHWQRQSITIDALDTLSPAKLWALMTPHLEKKSDSAVETVCLETSEVLATGWDSKPDQWEKFIHRNLLSGRADDFNQKSEFLEHLFDVWSDAQRQETEWYECIESIRLEERHLNIVFRRSRGTRDILGDFIEKERNYWVREQAKDFLDAVLHHLGEHGKELYEYRDRREDFAIVPWFKVDPVRYGRWSEDGRLLLSAPNHKAHSSFQRAIQGFLLETRHEDELGFVKQAHHDSRGHSAEDIAAEYCKFPLEPKNASVGHSNSSLTREDVRSIELAYRNEGAILDAFGDLNLSQRPLLEQVYFLRYLRPLNILAVHETQRFLRAYGTDGLRAFLAAHDDQDFAHELIRNGNLLLEGVMTDGDPFFKEILAAYCRVLDAADIARDVYRNRWGKEMSEEEFERVGAGLRERATLVLKKAVRGIVDDTDKRPDGTEEVPVERIRKELGQIEIDIVATTAIARELKLDPAAARGSSAGFIPGPTLKGMVGKALDIQEAQYEKRPPSFRKTVSEALQKAFENPDTEFFTIQVPPDSAKPNEKDLAGLFRLDTIKSDAGKVEHLHFASMLVNPKYTGARMMTNHAREALAARAQKTLIKAECFPKGADITHEYLEWGFVATGVTGALNMDLLQIEWDTARNRLLESTAVKMPKEEIIRRAGAVSPKKKSIGIRYGAHDAEPDFGTLFEPGFILTRYFKSSLGGKTRYYTVFEKDPLTEERPATRRRSSR